MKRTNLPKEIISPITGDNLTLSYNSNDVLTVINFSSNMNEIHHPHEKSIKSLLDSVVMYKNFNSGETIYIPYKDDY